MTARRGQDMLVLSWIICKSGLQNRTVPAQCWTGRSAGGSCLHGKEGGYGSGDRLADLQIVKNCVNQATHDLEVGAPPTRKAPLLPLMLVGALGLLVVDNSAPQNPCYGKGFRFLVLGGFWLRVVPDSCFTPTSHQEPRLACPSRESVNRDKTKTLDGLQNQRPWWFEPSFTSPHQIWLSWCLGANKDNWPWQACATPTYLHQQICLLHGFGLVGARVECVGERSDVL